MARGRRPPARQNQTPAASEPQAENRLHIQATRSEWSGPLPSPAHLEAFEQVAPGSAAIILHEFQTEAGHRRELEGGAQRLMGRETLLGQCLAIIFAVGCLGATVYAISQGAQWAASILGGGVILGGVTVFIKGRR